jgi:hypothetical protein
MNENINEVMLGITYAGFTVLGVWINDTYIPLEKWKKFVKIVENCEERKV